MKHVIKCAGAWLLSCDEFMHNVCLELEKTLRYNNENQLYSQSHWDFQNEKKQLHCLVCLLKLLVWVKRPKCENQVFVMSVVPSHGD